MLHGTRAFLSELCKADKMKRLGYHRRLDFHFICFTEFVFYLLAEVLGNDILGPYFNGFNLTRTYVCYIIKLYTERMFCTEKCFVGRQQLIIRKKEISEAIPDLSGTKYLGRWAANIIPVEIAQLNYSMRKKGAMKDDADDK